MSGTGRPSNLVNSSYVHSFASKRDFAGSQPVLTIATIDRARGTAISDLSTRSSGDGHHNPRSGLHAHCVD